MGKTIVIIAGNRSEFNHLIAGYKEIGVFNVEDNYIYADNVDKLRGLIIDKVVDFGTAFELNNYHDLLKYAYSRLKI